MKLQNLRLTPNRHKTVKHNSLVCSTVCDEEKKSFITLTPVFRIVERQRLERKFVYFSFLMRGFYEKAGRPMTSVADKHYIILVHVPPRLYAI